MSEDRLFEIAECAIGIVADILEYDGMIEVMKRNGITETELKALGFAED